MLNAAASVTNSSLKTCANVKRNSASLAHASQCHPQVALFNRKPNAKNNLVPGARTCNTSWMQERRQGAQLPCWLTAKEWKIGACKQEWNPI